VGSPREPLDRQLAGQVLEDVTSNVRTIKSIPLSIDAKKLAAA